MKRHIGPDGLGFFARVETQKERELFIAAANIMEKETGRDLSNKAFLEMLMRHYLDYAKSKNIGRVTL